MYDNYEIILSDSESLTLTWRDRHRMRTLERLIENFSECLGEDGRFRIAGTKYFWVDTIRPGTVKQISEGVTEQFFDGLYRMRGYGGYECGGRGCFYVKVA